MKNRKIILMVAGIWIAIDQISKAFIHKFLPLYKEITIIPNFFFFNHSQCIILIRNELLHKKRRKKSNHGK